MECKRRLLLKGTVHLNSLEYNKHHLCFTAEIKSEVWKDMRKIFMKSPESLSERATLEPEKSR